MKKGSKHTVESRLRQSAAASRRHSKGERRTRLTRAQAALQRAANLHREGDLDTD